MCGGNNNNNNNNSQRRTIVTDEYTFETTDETTVKYASPACVCPCPPPTVIVPKYEPPRYIPLKRCPSLTSVVTLNFPVSCTAETPTIRRCASNKRLDECTCNNNHSSRQHQKSGNNETETVVTLVNMPLNPPRPSRSRSRCREQENNNSSLVRSTSITYRSNENLNSNTDLSIKYDFEETIEEPRLKCVYPLKAPPCPPLPVYPSICKPSSFSTTSSSSHKCSCASKPAAQSHHQQHSHCTCPPKPPKCTCPPKPPQCTCPPKQQQQPKACSCSQKPYTPCAPLPSYPSLCSPSRLSSSKSFTNLTNIDTTTSNNNNNSLTYVYNDQDNDRQVTYIRHTDNDTGLSLPGCLVKASETNLPVNRSVNLGAIFNGNSFGLLTESIQIRDAFDLSFDFRTNSKDGILAIVVDINSNNSFFIELYDSQLKATLFIDGEADSCWTDFPSCLLSNDIWINVNVTLNNNKMCLTVKNNFYTKQHRCALRCPIRGDLFIAGHPSTVEPPFVCRSKSFFVGEMRNFCVNNNGVKWYGAPSSMAVRLRNWY